MSHLRVTQLSFPQQAAHRKELYVLTIRMRLQIPVSTGLAPPGAPLHVGCVRPLALLVCVSSLITSLIGLGCSLALNEVTFWRA